MQLLGIDEEDLAMGLGVVLRDAEGDHPGMVLGTGRAGVAMVLHEDVERWQIVPWHSPATILPAQQSPGVVLAGLLQRRCRARARRAAKLGLLLVLAWVAAVVLVAGRGM